MNVLELTRWLGSWGDVVGACLNGFHGWEEQNFLDVWSKKECKVNHE